MTDYHIPVAVADLLLRAVSAADDYNAARPENKKLAKDFLLDSELREVVAALHQSAPDGGFGGHATLDDWLDAIEAAHGAVRSGPEGQMIIRLSRRETKELILAARQPDCMAGEGREHLSPGDLFWGVMRASHIAANAAHVLRTDPDKVTLVLDALDRLKTDLDEVLNGPTNSHPDPRAICETLGFDPTNHHNAVACPYCIPDAALRAEIKEKINAG